MKKMIKVIASDLDGTLLNTEHKLDLKTFETIKKVQEQGVRFIVATGRDYNSTMEAIGEHKLECDYIVASGAEVRDPSGEVLYSTPMNPKYFHQILEVTQKTKVFVRYCTGGSDYFIGTKDESVRMLLSEAKLFYSNESEEIIRSSELFITQKERVKCVSSLEELMEMDIPIYKIFISYGDLDALQQTETLLQEVPCIASASSFAYNIELTHQEAQKGPVLKSYIEELGYQMDEVMVFGDSMNDYSMLSMDFGWTVAMENGMDEIKKVAKYITKSNAEAGVVHTIEEMICKKTLVG